MSITDDEQEITIGLGEALAKRMGLDDGVPPSPVSTDSPDDTEDAAKPAPVDAQDAGDQASEGAASEDEAADGVVTDAPSAAESITVGDTTYTPAQIRAMQELTNWAHGLSPELKQALASVELGQAAAVPLDEYRRFQAWKSTARQQPDEDLFADLDPEQQNYIRQLEAERDQLRASSQQPTIAAARNDIAAGQQAWEAAFQTASDAFARDNALTPEQVTALAHVALDHGMFDHYARLERQFHPVNQTLIRDADPMSVTTKALDYALKSDPQLYTQVLTAKQEAQRRAIQDAAADSAISVKKARSASLATAPSQATVTPPIDPRKMTPDELKSAMAATIKQLEGL